MNVGSPLHDVRKIINEPVSQNLHLVFMYPLPVSCWENPTRGEASSLKQNCTPYLSNITILQKSHSSTYACKDFARVFDMLRQHSTAGFPYPPRMVVESGRERVKSTPRSRTASRRDRKSTRLNSSHLGI